MLYKILFNLLIIAIPILGASLHLNHSIQNNFTNAGAEDKALYIIFAIAPYLSMYSIAMFIKSTKFKIYMVFAAMVITIADDWIISIQRYPDSMVMYNTVFFMPLAAIVLSGFGLLLFARKKA